MCLSGYQKTYKRPKRLPALLLDTGLGQTAPIRGAARLLRRGTALARGCPRFRLQHRLLPGPVPSLSARHRPGILRLASTGAAGSAEEVRRARPDRGTAQAQLLGLRDQRVSEEAPTLLKPDRRARGAQGRGIRASASARR